MYILKNWGFLGDLCSFLKFIERKFKKKSSVEENLKELTLINCKQKK